MQFWVSIKHVFKFAVKYLKYMYYGLKQRIKSLFLLNLSFFGLFRSLFRLPFEAWHFTQMEIRHAK